MGKCHFRDEWLTKKDDLGFLISKWAKKGNSDDAFFCIICHTSVKVTKGFQAVIQHYCSKRHKQNAKAKLSTSQCTLIFTDSTPNANDASKPSCVSTSTSENPSVSLPTAASELCGKTLTENNVVSVTEVPPTKGLLQFMSPADSASKVEIIWTLVMITKKFSAQSCEGISNIFKAMFPSSVPEGFSLSPKKFSYLITEALGPYFREVMLKDAQREYFSLQFDETTNNKGKKELQINIKFWSSIRNEIIAHHLETAFIGTAKAENVSDCILSSLSKSSLSLSHLVSIGSDGPAVNHKIFRLLNEETIAVRGKCLLPVGTCNLHHVHNAFLKGLEAFGSDVPDLVIAVYYFFHGWPSREEEYASSQKQEKVPQHAFIKHVPSRWLTLKDAACRLLEQWPALQHYFLKFLPLHKSLSSISSCSKIATLLKKKTMKAEINFVISSSDIFLKFSTLFQKEEPLIHILHQHFTTLLQILMGRVCKRKCTEQDVITMEDFDTENLLAPKQVHCGQLVADEMQSLSECDQLEIRIGIKRHYVACAKYLVKKLDKMLKFFSFLQPAAINNPESCKYIVEIARALPGEIKIDIVLDEWKLLQTEHAVIKISTSNSRIDHFWREIFEMKNYVNEEKYPTIKKIVKMCLSVYHGSADVERGFSLSGRILTKERAAMGERTLNARLNVIDGLKSFNNDPLQVPITKELLKVSQNAHRSYTAYCEEQKKKENERIVEKQKKRGVEDEGDKIQIGKKVKTDIQSMKLNLTEARKKYKEKKETREKLFLEANERLKAAISKSDLKEVSLAQAMMQGVESLKSEEVQFEKKLANLEKAIDKKTSSYLFQN